MDLLVQILLGVQTARVIPIFHDLLEEKHIQFVKSKSITNHDDPRNQEANIKEATQERQVVDCGVKLPVDLDQLISLVEIPVLDHLRVFSVLWVVSLRVIRKVVHTV